MRPAWVLRRPPSNPSASPLLLATLLISRKRGAQAGLPNTARTCGAPSTIACTSTYEPRPPYFTSYTSYRTTPFAASNDPTPTATTLFSHA